MDGEEPPQQTFSPVRHVLAESCRYTTGFQKEELRDIYDLENSLKHFYEILSMFQSSVFAANSLELVLRDCERFAPAAKCPNFYLSINDSYLQSDADQNASTYGPVSHLMACAGSSVPVSYDTGHVYASYPTADLLPPEVPMDSNVYTVLPLHRNEACIGMAIAEGVPKALKHGFLTLFLTLLANSIENTRKQQMLQDANERLDSLYVHDELTGLYNRFGLERYGTIAYDHLLRDFAKTEFIFVDIDDMKGINDVYGHRMGDATICDTADVIRRATSDENAFAMRWGGDELLLICRRNLVPKLEAELELLNESTSRPYALNLSIGGYRVSADDGLTLTQAIKRADARMYEVKKEHHRRA